ncbi:MAG: alpha-glucan family phosphorylase [Thermomicrobiales bacterium]|nr:alpha-glucan family phosphorylase [Thermomicrobiales bacterium]
MSIAPFQTAVPSRIDGLTDLAHNLWWSWNREAVELFRVIDPAGWLATERNPVRFLLTVSPVYLETVAGDPEYLAAYDAVMARFRAETSDDNSATWIGQDRPAMAGKTLGYLSAEFGLHPTLPIYSGGLGVLAGDHIKAASDLGLKLVGVSLLYRQGYLRQRLDGDGWQQDVPGSLVPEFEPATPVLGPDGSQLQVEVVLDNPDLPLKIAIWQVLVGRQVLLLLDSDVEGNPEWTRSIASRLYGGDREHRLRQEIILGIAGVRALHAAGYDVDYWHGNEGHAAFHLLERCRMLVAEGMTFEQASEQVISSSIFTTHTPVAAGHDVFPDEMIDRYFSHFWPQLGIDRDSFLALGAHESTGPGFNLTALSFRLSGYANGVSKLHGEVTRTMWHDMWPGLDEADVPVSSVTNGVHIPTWIGRHMADLYFQELGDAWRADSDNQEVWDGILDVPDDDFWARRRRSKRSMLRYMRDRSRVRWLASHDSGNALIGAPFFEEGILTIGFARRFATYKRATLLFHNPERLSAILTNPECPVQLVFAGKAHPADEGGKRLIQEIVWSTRDPLFGGRIAFAEDYDMQLASYLVSGVDVWLNNPRAPLEASGTSGMKAAANGVPNLSILDGWWAEGWVPGNANGWGIAPYEQDDELNDGLEANAIYDLLENEIVPLYYRRGADGVPHDWITVAKQSIRTVAPQFSARRMLKEYVDDLYAPAAGVER